MKTCTHYVYQHMTAHIYTSMTPRVFSNMSFFSKDQIEAGQMLMKNLRLQKKLTSIKKLKKKSMI